MRGSLGKGGLEVHETSWNLCGIRIKGGDDLAFHHLVGDIEFEEMEHTYASHDLANKYDMLLIYMLYVHV